MPVVVSIIHFFMLKIFTIYSGNICLPSFLPFTERTETAMLQSGNVVDNVVWEWEYLRE